MSYYVVQIQRLKQSKHDRQYVSAYREIRYAGVTQLVEYQPSKPIKLYLSDHSAVHNLLTNMSYKSAHLRLPGR